MTEPTPDPKSAGRPRPSATVERDDKVLNFLNEQKDEASNPVGKSRDEIATALAIPGNEVYLSLYRLKRDGKVTKGGSGGSQKWTAATAVEVSA